MSKNWLAYLGAPAVALAGLLLLTPTVSAQRFGGGRLGGIGYGNGYGSGYANPWYGGNYYGGNGFGWNNGAYSGYNNSYYPGWNSSFGNTYPNNYHWGNNWNSYPNNSFYSNQPTYYSSGQFTTNMVPGQPYTSFYSAANLGGVSIPENAALVRVQVPADAKVWFSDHETQQQGQFREFVTPALDKGQNYYYDVRARWNENGQPVERTRKVLVHAGDRSNVDFSRDENPTGATIPVTPGSRSQSGYQGLNDQNRNGQLNRNNETVPAPVDRSDLNRGSDNLNRPTTPNTTTPPATTPPPNPSGPGNPNNPQGNTNNPGTNK